MKGEKAIIARNRDLNKNSCERESTCGCARARTCVRVFQDANEGGEAIIARNSDLNKNL